jgi:hypothetical protein
MSDNSEVRKLTKIDAETEFQPKDTCKKRSKCTKIFRRVGNIFMTLIISDYYKSYIQSQLHDFVDDPLSTIGKLAISYGESKTWDEWATHFEHKDLNTLNLRENGIFFMLCTRMQDSLLNKVSDPSFSWASISLEEKMFHLECVTRLEEYLYENSKISVRRKIANYFTILRFCNEFWINFFDVVNDYNELCHKYIQIIFEANRKYTEKNILDSGIKKQETIRQTQESLQSLTESLPITTFDEKLVTAFTSEQLFDVRSLYPSQKSYEYITTQAKSFKNCLPELISKYPGEYVLFEDGNVIDHDLDEDILLERLWKNSFVKERMKVDGSGIYCHLVPKTKSVNV